MFDCFFYYKSFILIPKSQCHQTTLALCVFGKKIKTFKKKFGYCLAVTYLCGKKTWIQNYFLHLISTCAKKKHQTRGVFIGTLKHPNK